MTDTLENMELKKNLADSFKQAKAKGNQIVALVSAVKSQVASDKQAIQDADLTVEEKTQWRDEYTSALSSIKTAIETALNS